MTDTTDPQQVARDRLLALIASIPGSGGVDWCGKARALLNEIAAAPAAVPSAPADRTALPETARLHDQILTLQAELASVRDLLRTENERANSAIDRETTGEEAEEEQRLALSQALGLGTGAPWDAIRERAAELAAPADRAAMLSRAERTMLTYALNQAQLRMWATGKFTDEDQAAVVSLRRMADEAQQPETQDDDDPSWPRRAWELGLLHKGGDPHHCPACLKQPEPPPNFVCPGDNTEVLANPQPSKEA